MLPPNFGSKKWKLSNFVPLPGIPKTARPFSRESGFLPQHIGFFEKFRLHMVFRQVLHRRYGILVSD